MRKIGAILLLFLLPVFGEAADYFQADVIKADSTIQGTATNATAVGGTAAADMATDAEVGSVSNAITHGGRFYNIAGDTILFDLSDDMGSEAKLYWDGTDLVFPNDVGVSGLFGSVGSASQAYLDFSDDSVAFISEDSGTPSIYPASRRLMASGGQALSWEELQLYGTWSMSNSASADNQIVNYQVLTNKVALGDIAATNASQGQVDAAASAYLHVNGDNAMTGPLNMGQKAITNAGNIAISNDLEYTATGIYSDNFGSEDIEFYQGGRIDVTDSQGYMSICDDTYTIYVTGGSYFEDRAGNWTLDLMEESSGSAIFLEDVDSGATLEWGNLYDGLGAGLKSVGATNDFTGSRTRVADPTAATDAANYQWTQSYVSNSAPAYGELYGVGTITVTTPTTYTAVTGLSATSMDYYQTTLTTTGITIDVSGVYDLNASVSHDGHNGVAHYLAFYKGNTFITESEMISEIDGDRTYLNASLSALETLTVGESVQLRVKAGSGNVVLYKVHIQIVKIR